MDTTRRAPFLPPMKLALPSWLAQHGRSRSVRTRFALTMGAGAGGIVLACW